MNNLSLQTYLHTIVFEHAESMKFKMFFFSQGDLTFPIIIINYYEHCGVLTRYVKWQTILLSFFIYSFSMYLKSIYFYIFGILSLWGVLTLTPNIWQ